jgi:hypothetical protein
MLEYCKRCPSKDTEICALPYPSVRRSLQRQKITSWIIDALAASGSSLTGHPKSNENSDINTSAAKADSEAAYLPSYICALNYQLARFEDKDDDKL